LRRIGAVLPALAAIFALTTSSALAVPPGTLDQHQDVTTGGGTFGWSNTYALAQTFTTAYTGYLQGVSIYIGETTPPNVVPAVVGPNGVDNDIRIGATTAGIPGGLTVAHNAAFSIPSSPGWVDWVLSTPLLMATGSTVAIIVQTTGAQFNYWQGDCTADAYSGGAAFVFDPAVGHWESPTTWGTANSHVDACQQDFAFRTYMVAAPDATAPPTAPPTSTATVAKSADNGGLGLLLFFAAGLAAAAAFVTARRYGLARR
jgi:hypothetical protein